LSGLIYCTGLFTFFLVVSGSFSRNVLLFVVISIMRIAKVSERMAIPKEGAEKPNE
jgi:hypothetical protein